MAQLKAMDAELAKVMAQEEQKRLELASRRAQLAERVRSAYDTDRTSPLETFLSGGSFTDLLAEMSYYIDVGEQDKALAEGIAKDKETLTAIHQTVADTRDRTNVLRQRQRLRSAISTRRCARSRRRRRSCAASRSKSPGRLRSRRRDMRPLARNKRNAAAIIRQGRRRPAHARQADRRARRRAGPQRAHPQQFNGTMRWPMDSFTVSGDFGCSSFEYYAPGHGCAHFHNGIDLVAPSGPRSRPPPPGPSSSRLELGRRPRPGLDRGHRPRAAT